MRLTFFLISLAIIVAFSFLLGSYVLSMIKYIAKLISDRFTIDGSDKNAVDTIDTLYNLCTSEDPYSHPIIAKLRHEIDVIKHGFPDRSKEIPIFKSLALEAWKQNDWVVARTYFFKLVESLKQQNHRCNGAHETEWREAQKAYSEFAKSDPLVNSVIESVRSIIASNPGMTQAKIYPLLKNFKKEDVQYGLYFGAEQGKINRIKKGRSYILSLDIPERLCLIPEPKESTIVISSITTSQPMLDKLYSDAFHSVVKGIDAKGLDIELFMSDLYNSHKLGKPREEYKIAGRYLDSIDWHWKTFDESFPDFEDKYKKKKAMTECLCQRISNLYYSISKWRGIVETKVAFPFLMMSAVDDCKTVPECGNLDGIIRAVDDMFWKDNYPPHQHLSCRCSVIQLTPRAAERELKKPDCKLRVTHQAKSVSMCPADN